MTWESRQSPDGEPGIAEGVMRTRLEIVLKTPISRSLYQETGLRIEGISTLQIN